MDRIVVIGSPGAGKTTFARRLGDLLRIEPIYLDRYFWDANWKEKPIEARIAIQHKLVDGDRWIIEGTYLDSSDERLDTADTVIFLDIHWLLCLLRVLIRRIKYHKKTRPDLPEGCTERIRLPYFLKVLVFPQRGRRLFFKKKKEIEGRQLYKEEKTAFYWLRSTQEVEAFLQEQTTFHSVVQALIENQKRCAGFKKVVSMTAFIFRQRWKSLVIAAFVNFGCFGLIIPRKHFKSRGEETSSSHPYDFSP